MRAVPLALAALVIAGCQWPGAPAPQPSAGGAGPAAPAPFATPEPTAPEAPASYTPYDPVLLAASPTARAGASDAGFKLVGGALEVHVTDGARPVTTGVVVDLYGPTLATAVGDVQGKAGLSPLAVGPGYQLLIRAPGFATLKQNQLEVRQKLTTTVKVSLVPGAIASGRVTAGGQPVAGAVVSDGLNATLTDAQGHYVLTGISPGEVALRASKPRFAPATRAATLSAGQNGAVDLELAPTTGTLFLDTRTSGLPADRLAGFKQALADRQWRLVDAPPGPEGVWVLVCPSRALSAEVMAQATTFAAHGGKLVLLGEWGGFSGFNNPAANALAHSLGLHFNPDLLRELALGAPEWLSIRQFAAPAFGQAPPATVRLFSACSLFGLSTMLPLATTGPKAYRVQQAGESAGRAVAMGGPFAAGKAIAVGDTSAWSDDDSDANGTPDGLESDNMLFWERLLDW